MRTLVALSGKPNSASKSSFESCVMTSESLDGTGGVPPLHTTAMYGILAGQMISTLGDLETERHGPVLSEAMRKGNSALRIRNATVTDTALSQDTPKVPK